MIYILLFIYSLLSNNFNEILKQKKIKKNNILFNGYDQRYLTNKTENYHTFNKTVNMHCIYNDKEETTPEKIFKFKKMFFQLELLNYLNKTNDSEINKLLALENYEKQFNTDKLQQYKVNLFGGGLFTDWNRNNDF